MDSNAIRERLAGWEGTTDEDRSRQLDRIIVYATLAPTESSEDPQSVETTNSDKSPSFRFEDLLAHLKQLDLSVAPDEIRRSLTRLELSFVLARDADRYVYRVPLFVRMIRNQHPAELLRMEVEQRQRLSESNLEPT